jgi:hypothetical protein
MKLDHPSPPRFSLTIKEDNMSPTKAGLKRMLQLSYLPPFAFGARENVIRVCFGIYAEGMVKAVDGSGHFTAVGIRLLIWSE